MKTISFLFLLLVVMVFCGALSALNNKHVDKVVNKLLYVVLFISIILIYSLIFIYYDTFRQT